MNLFFTNGITLREHKALKTQLISSLKKRIERLSPSIFMPRNTEEIMKNILILSQELHSSKDIPQVMISLEKQTLDQLFFTVTLAMISKQENTPFRQLFENSAISTGFLLESTQIIGYLEDGTPKEAHIFQLQLQRSLFLRYDSSTNFYAARKKIVSLLEEVLGEIRDYNGGIFLKQGEVLSQLKENLSSCELVEDLFYSIAPLEMQVILPLSTLQNFLQLALKVSEEEPSGHENYTLRIEQNAEQSFFVLHTHDFSLRSILEKALRQNSSICSFSITHQEKLLTGYLCYSADLEKQNEFFLQTQQTLASWEKEKKGLNLIRLYYQDWPYSLDPRLGGDIHSTKTPALYCSKRSSPHRRNSPDSHLLRAPTIREENSYPASLP